MTYETLPDEELAKRAQSNDSAAVNELLHRHKSLVNKAVRRFFLPSGDTDDLVQEGMVALFNAIMNTTKKPARVSQRSPTSASAKESSG